MLVTWAVFIPSFTTAHGGRTNDSGCHNDKARNHYHCHNSLQDNTKSPLTSNPIVIKNTSKPNASNYYYDRKQWPHWSDSDQDCQNTRAEIFIAQSIIDVLYRNTKRCSVVYGRWIDPYSGKFLSMTKDIDIDHVVPLSWANRRGGFYWSKAKKKRFANDWDNLLIVSDSLNRMKGDKGPDKWLPPIRSFHCKYIGLFDQIVQKYGLKYINQESEKIAEKLLKCK